MNEEGFTKVDIGSDHPVTIIVMVGLVVASIYVFYLFLKNYHIISIKKNEKEDI